MFFLEWWEEKAMLAQQWNKQQTKQNPWSSCDNKPQWLILVNSTISYLVQINTFHKRSNILKQGVVHSLSFSWSLYLVSFLKEKSVLKESQKRLIYILVLKQSDRVIKVDRTQTLKPNWVFSIPRVSRVVFHKREGNLPVAVHVEKQSSF